MCAQNGVPERVVVPTPQGILMLELRVEGGGFDANRLHPLRCRALPCKCPGHVYLEVRGEVAERLKAAVC